MRGALATVAFVACAASAACGGQPALAGLPRPNPAVVAGAAAAIAGAATLANPAAAGHKPEAPGPGVEPRPVATEQMPNDVLDRMDQPQEPSKIAPAPQQRPEAAPQPFPMP